MEQRIRDVRGLFSGGNVPLDGIDVDGDVLQLADSALHLRTEFGHLKHPLRSRVIAGSFDSEKVMRQVADTVLYLREIDRECAVGICEERAFIEQVVDL